MECPPEIYDEALRIAKVWGCVCTPRVTFWEQSNEQNRLTVKLRHQVGCHYDPGRYFRPEVEIDEEAIADSAKKMKKRRASATRKYTKKRGTK